MANVSAENLLKPSKSLTAKVDSQNKLVKCNIYETLCTSVAINQTVYVKADSVNELFLHDKKNKQTWI